MRIVRLAAIAVAATGLALYGADRASAGVVVTIDKASRRMAVEVDGAARYLCRPESSFERTGDTMTPTVADTAAVPITVIRGGEPGPVWHAGPFPRIIAVR